MNRPTGMHPTAFNNYIWACFGAHVSPDRVMQTVGTAPASAGSHKADTNYKFDNGHTEPITGAIDLRTKDLTPTQIQNLLYFLFHAGFVGWWRHEGSFKDNQHIHAIWVGMKLKPFLQAQFWDFLAGNDGLASHQKSRGVKATVEQQTKLIALFQQHNKKGAK